MAANSKKIMIINPNTTEAMTEALKPLLDSLNLANVEFVYWTAPSGVPSINNEDDALISANACFPNLKPELKNNDAFLVCCYSQHPLVTMLRDEMVVTGQIRPVTGIFEASIATCLQSIKVGEKFGIVSTGKQWEAILGQAVANLLGTPYSAILGAPNSSGYAGTQTTGLDADQLHVAPPDEVRALMVAATKRLLSQKAEAICLGCAGMAGMDKIVREACVNLLGEAEGNRIKIVDGVVSGALFLYGALHIPGN